MIRIRQLPSTVRIDRVARAMADLERIVAAVKGLRADDSTLSKALATLETLAAKEDIPLAIVGGLAAIYHGYERFTKDIDIVVPKANLDVIARVAPHYGIKVIWKDPDGWHKLSFEGLPIDIVPEGGRPRNDAPTAIPGPKHLGVQKGAGYSGLGGWVETKLGSYRIQDQADVVQVLKKTTSAAIKKIRKHLASVHATYVSRFEKLLESAQSETEQERQRGGSSQ